MGPLYPRIHKSVLIQTLFSCLPIRVPRPDVHIQQYVQLASSVTESLGLQCTLYYKSHIWRSQITYAPY